MSDCATIRTYFETEAALEVEGPRRYAPTLYLVLPAVANSYVRPLWASPPFPRPHRGAAFMPPPCLAGPSNLA